MIFNINQVPLPRALKRIHFSSLLREQNVMLRKYFYHILTNESINSARKKFRNYREIYGPARSRDSWSSIKALFGMLKEREIKRDAHKIDLPKPWQKNRCFIDAFRQLEYHVSTLFSPRPSATKRFSCENSFVIYSATKATHEALEASRTWREITGQKHCKPSWLMAERKSIENSLKRPYNLILMELRRSSARI